MENTKLGKNIEQYIGLVYSEKSEFSKIVNLKERKLAACKKVGLDPKSEKVIALMDLTDEKSRNAIIDFMCMNESNEFMNLMSDQFLFWEIQSNKMTPLTNTEDEEKMLKAVNLKTTMSLKSQELLSRMDASYAKIFKGEAETKAAKKKVKWTFLEQRIKQREEQAKLSAEKKSVNVLHDK